MTHGLPSLSIEGGPPLGRNAVVKLDGREVPGLRGLHLSMASDEINVVTLIVAVDQVHVDAEVLAELHAIVDAKADNE